MNSNSEGKSNYIYLLILLLTMISSQIISDRTIKPNVPKRINIQDSILAGQYEAPYQYRIMKPVLGKSVQFFVKRFIRNPENYHVVSYHIIIFIVFFGVFTLLYFYLKLFFSENVCMIGLLLMQIVIPLGITSIWEEGDYITLLFYLIGFNLMFRKKEYLLPLVVLFGVFNRDQIIYILAFYVAFLIGDKRLFTKKGILIIVMCLAAYFISYYAMRFYFGFKINYYVTEIQTSTNIGHWKAIMGLWAEQVFVFLALCIISYKKAVRFSDYHFLVLSYM